MPESRHRLYRPVDIAELFARRRTGPLGILRDDTEATNLFGSPTRHLGFGGPFGGLAPRRRPGLRSPRSVIGRGGQSVFSTHARRGENRPPGGSMIRGRGRVRNSVLPSWFPRTPLRDVTAIVRAIERRRDGEGHGTEDHVPEGDRLTDYVQPGSAAPREHVTALATPSSVKKHSKFLTEKMSKTLLKFSTLDAEDPEFLTPQKKLLNSIETVEMILLEDLQRMRRTPSAKRAGREKKVRTLMSMR